MDCWGEGRRTRRSVESQQSPTRDDGVCGCRERSADTDYCGGGFDDGSGRSGAAGGEQVCRAVYLAVEVVPRTAAAQAAAGREDGCVREEDADGVIVAGDGQGGDRGEGGGDGVPEFWLEGAAVVGEGEAECLAADDEDCACGEDDAVGEDSGKGHGVDCFNGGCSHWGTDCDDVSVCRCVGALL